MASRYWVGGAGNWDATTTTHWSATSGGAGGASVPTSADDVFFNASSGAGIVTLAVNATTRDLNCTGFTGTLAMGARTLNIYGSLTLSAAMTLTFTATTALQMAFKATTAGKTVTTAGKTMPTVDFNGVGGEWILQDAFTNNPTGSINGITLTAGTLRFNGKSVTSNKVNSTVSTNVRTLDLGSGTLTVNNGGAFAMVSTNLTLISASATLVVGAGAVSIDVAAAGATFANLTISATGTFTVSGTGGLTVTGTLTYNPAQTKTNVLAFAGSVTVGSLVSNAASWVNGVSIRSNLTGTARTFTAGAVTLANVDFRDVAGAGAAAPFTGSGLNDLGGSTGITFDVVPRTLYWVGGSGNWSDSTHWSLTSGGAGGQNPPISCDTARFDNNSYTGAGQSVTCDMARPGNVDWSAMTGNDLKWTTSAAGEFYGDVILSPAMRLTVNNGSSYNGRRWSNWNLAGQSWGNALTIAAPGGGIRLGGHYVSTFNISIGAGGGGIDANGFNVTIGGFSAQSAGARTILMGTGTWTVTGVWSVSMTAATFDGSQATLVLDSGATNVGHGLGSGAASVYGTIIVPAGTGTVQFNANPTTINTLTIAAGRTIIWNASQTKNITNWNVVGTPGNLITFQSTTPGTRYTLSKPSGIVVVEHVVLSDSIAAGGAQWYAANSVDAGNNVGWVFGYPLPPEILHGVVDVEDGDGFVGVVVGSGIAVLDVAGGSAEVEDEPTPAVVYTLGDGSASVDPAAGGDAAVDDQAVPMTVVTVVNPQVVVQEN